MEDARKELLRWAGEVEGRSTADWDNLPDLGLYMDQVVTYVERQLAAVWRLEREKPLTPAMVNNYANGQMLPRADGQKKYSRDHLAMLLILCTLKPVMPIAGIGRLLAGYRQEGDMDDLYRTFRESQVRAMAETAGILRAAMEDVPEGGESEAALRKLALGLAVEANARSLAAERILALLAEQAAAAAREQAERAEREKAEKSEKAEREKTEKAEREKAERAEREKAEKAAKEARESKESKDAKEKPTGR